MQRYIKGRIKKSVPITYRNVTAHFFCILCVCRKFLLTLVLQTVLHRLQRSKSCLLSTTIQDPNKGLCPLLEFWLDILFSELAINSLRMFANIYKLYVLQHKKPTLFYFFKVFGPNAGCFFNHFDARSFGIVLFCALFGSRYNRSLGL